MNQPSTTSFIPKRVLDKPERSKRQSSNLLLMISFLLLILSGAFFGGAIFWKSRLNQGVLDLEAAVEREEKNLDRATILVFQNFDSKLRIAKDLLAEHNTILPAIKMLEELTLPTVGYTRFSYSEDSLVIDGQATKYEDIAVQSDIFTKDERRIKSFIFSDLDLDREGNVIFKLTIIPESDIFSFLKNQNP